jgi:hypothetical protein
VPQASIPAPAGIKGLTFRAPPPLLNGLLLDLLQTKIQAGCGLHPLLAALDLLPLFCP